MSFTEINFSQKLIRFGGMWRFCKIALEPLLRLLEPAPFDQRSDAREFRTLRGGAFPLIKKCQQHERQRSELPAERSSPSVSSKIIDLALLQSALAPKS